MSDEYKVKYNVSSSQKEDSILTNLLNLTSEEEINKSEFEGFLRSERIMIETLTLDTEFNLKYIKNIHKYALYHLYGFAGQYRSVNISKDGFLFPPAKFISDSMISFEKKILNRKFGDSKDETIKQIAMSHAELLFIHPFREGNGRTARILANMMSYKAGYNRLKFEELTIPEKFQQYIIAVQKAGIGQYENMIKIIQEIS